MGRRKHPPGASSDHGAAAPKEDVEAQTSVKSRVANSLFIPGLNSILNHLGLDADTMLKILKGGLPPTIAVAIYQSNAIADITQTVGYLTALITIVSQCLLPRAKFMKIIFFNLLATCMSASLCCLAIFCAVKAREHTSPFGGTIQDYNSSACAVSALWLIFAIWISNTLRAYQPVELQDPMVSFSIFSGITLTHAGQFPTIAEGFGFTKQLLLAFLLGFAIATGVSLLILPITSRRNVFKGIEKYAVTIQAVLKAQADYIQASQDHLLPKAKLSTTQGPVEKALNSEDEILDVDIRAMTLKSTMAGLISIHDKLHADLSYAKGEIAWGKLVSTDLEIIFGLLRSFLLSLAGISLLPGVFQKLNQEWVNSDQRVHNSRFLMEDYEEKILAPLVAALATTTELINTGICHTILLLQISSKKKEKAVDILREDFDTRISLVPGSRDFASHIQERIENFCIRQNKIDMVNSLATMAESRQQAQANIQKNDPEASSLIAEELFVFLFMEHLLESLLQATLDLVKFADQKVEDGTMKQNRLIYPQDRLARIFFFLGNSNIEKETRKEDVIVESEPGKSSARPIDPEHLQPSNAWERGGNWLRSISHFLASDESTFGFRAAAASSTVVILAYLRQTQTFFFQQRLIWALIVIVIGMSPTSGASLFSFAGRIVGTIVSLVLSLIVWYIVVGHTVGVIIFLYFANVFEYYFYVKYPRYIGPCVISIVTLNVIVAYELQVSKLGITKAESSGQPYYPIYLFGPYKLLCVIAGCAIAFIWTILPYPISARARVRQMLGRSLFVLANFYSCMHTTIKLWIDEAESEVQSHPELLESAQRRLFAEEMGLLTALRTHSHFTTFEPSFGGKFPKSIYDEVIAEIQNIIISMALMAQKPKGLPAGSRRKEGRWLRQLAHIIQQTDFDSHIITSLLCHVSAAVSNGSPLPPYLSPPGPFPLARRLRKLNKELLDVRNVEDPTFSTFASLEVLSSLVNSNMENLISNVKLLVGEVSFDGYINRRPRRNPAQSDDTEKID